MGAHGLRSHVARRSTIVVAVLAGRLRRFRRTDLRSPGVRHRYVDNAGLWLPAVHTGLCRTRLRHIALSSVRSGRMVGADNGVAIVAVPAHPARPAVPARSAIVARPVDRACPSAVRPGLAAGASRSEEHTSELQSLMRISYAVFGL